MAQALARPLKTVRDYLALPDDVRAELIEGGIYVTPSPTPDHYRIGRRIVRRLEDWASAGGGGEVFGEPLDVFLPSGEVVQPDVFYFARGHRAVVRKRVRGVPDIAIEVVSPSHPERDRIVKRRLYAENGVPEYWIVDLTDEGVEVLRLEAAAYRPAGWFRRGSVLTTATLPGFALPVDEVFAPRG